MDLTTEFNKHSILGPMVAATQNADADNNAGLAFKQAAEQRFSENAASVSTPGVKPL